MAILREFNNESLHNYFARALRLLNKEGKNEDYKLTIPHVGCSHFMHIVRKNLCAIQRLNRDVMNSKEGSKNVWYRFNMYCMSLLVNAETLDEFEMILKDITVCLMSKFLSDKVQEAYDRIVRRVARLGNETIDDIVDNAKQFENAVVSESTEETSVSTSANPLNSHFHNLVAPVIEQLEQDNEDEDHKYTENRSWCPPFFKFIQSYICEMPLWSAVLLGSLDRYKTGHAKSNV